MNKIVRIGKVNIGNKIVNLFCNIKLQNEKLSISGVEGPTNNGNCHGGCGQIIMSDWKIEAYAKGWNSELVSQFRAVWKKWHLNKMQAGSPKQTEFLDNSNFKDYESACKALGEAGLNPDASYLHNGKPYKYGSAWLQIDIPAEVVSFLESLPETDIKPAWV